MVFDKIEHKSAKFYTLLFLTTAKIRHRYMKQGRFYYIS